MRDLERSIERAYRDAVAVTPYSSISVLSLCEAANVSRKMFYRHFKGKNEVLRYVFDRDVLAPQIELCRILSFEKMSAFAPEMELHMFDAVRKDGTFYCNVVNAEKGGQDAFVCMATAALHEFNLIMLREYGFRGTSKESDYIASFYAHGKASFMVKWIREHFPLPADEVADLYSRMVLPFWMSLF